MSRLSHLLEYFHKRKKCSFECSSILLGALSRQLWEMSLLIADSQKPFPGYDIASTVAALKKLKSPSWGDRGTSSWDDRRRSGWGDRESYNETHGCSLVAFIQPYISSLADALKGLKLKEVHLK